MEVVEQDFFQQIRLGLVLTKELVVNGHAAEPKIVICGPSQHDLVKVQTWKANIANGFVQTIHRIPPGLGDDQLTQFGKVLQGQVLLQGP